MIVEILVHVEQNRDTVCPLFYLCSKAEDFKKIYVNFYFFYLYYILLFLGGGRGWGYQIWILDRYIGSDFQMNAIVTLFMSVIRSTFLPLFFIFCFVFSFYRSMMTSLYLTQLPNKSPLNAIVARVNRLSVIPHPLQNLQTVHVMTSKRLVIMVGKWRLQQKVKETRDKEIIKMHKEIQGKDRKSNIKY